MKSRTRPTAWVAFAVASLCPCAAQAHLMSTGVGPFYDGFVHVLLTPVDGMAVVSVALLSGLRGAQSGRWALCSVSVSWAVGGFAGFTGFFLDTDPESLLVGAAIVPLVLGLGVALDLRLPLFVTTMLAVLVGLGFGLLNGLSLATTGAPTLVLLGILVGVFAGVALITAATVRWAETDTWRRVAVRAAGSWITAISLLMIGWTLRTMVS